MHVHVKVHDAEQFWRGKYHFFPTAEMSQIEAERDTGS